MEDKAGDTPTLFYVFNIYKIFYDCKSKNTLTRNAFWNNSL